jgi:putative oxidoreductase
MAGFAYYCIIRNSISHGAYFIALGATFKMHSIARCIARHPQGAVMNESVANAYAALLLRLALGTMFIAHALLKYFVFTLPGTAQFFESLGLPGVLGYATFAAELGGGVLLILGVRVRAVAIALIPVLLGATWAHSGNGWLFTSPKGGWEYPAFWTVALVVQALLGNGAFALVRGESAPALQRA